MAGSPLCDPAFSQLTSDRKRRSYVFSWRRSRPFGEAGQVHSAEEEDRVVCERVWFDFATILRQIGVLAS
jgi:hypothetical protein